MNYEDKEALDEYRDRALLAEELLRELWADGSVRAAVGEGDPGDLYGRVEAALATSP